MTSEQSRKLAELQKTNEDLKAGNEAMKARCFDPNWRYIREESTDIRKTFARIRRQQKLQAEAEAAALVHVTPIKRTGTK